MADLRLNTDVVRECGRALRHVQDELTACGSISQDYADRIGHPKLAEAVRDFVGNWDNTRNEIVAVIAGLGSAATGIADGLDGVEAALAAALRGGLGPP